MKKKLAHLAIFGGTPAFKENLHVGRPNIGDRQRYLARVNDILDRRWLTNNGIYVQELERQIADMLGVKHCIATSNGTVALEIAIRAAGLTGEVIVPSMTFVATAHALQWQGITPVFCDIDPRTYTLDPECVKEMITPRTTGIIGVHLWGRPCDVEALSKIARQHHLKLLYDAAHAFGCSFKGRMVGNFGDAEVFSFHATKFFNTVEGGAVVTNDDKLAESARLMRNFGFAGEDNVVCIGTNGKMNEMSAAMGLTLLESLDELVATNYHHYQQYQHDLAGIPGVNLMAYPENERCNFQYIVVDIDPGVTSISRDDLLAILQAENVLARRYFYPGCHRMEPYRSYYPYAGLVLPTTERMLDRLLCLPTGTAIESQTISDICQIIRFVIANSSQVKDRLQELASKRTVDEVRAKTEALGVNWLPERDVEPARPCY
ncbi:MAG: aminotransferase class I/II-fold pyridoxal phosphate-dependent enzyme [Anaerolineae bacterium]